MGFSLFLPVCPGSQPSFRFVISPIKRSSHTTIYGELTCPDCGGESFKVNTNSDTENDFIGSVCSSCGHVINQADIDAAVEKFTETLAADIAAHLGKLI
ncbi:TFIIB-type zinc ribbon-containing protein [Neisseria weixii]|uniref:TFIIB-type zinc ribbon-containing protein n=1 Tax=Neisseria weixii TaxID=1853276 RepID=UPI0035A06D4E